MKTLIVIRHAKSSWDDLSLQDIDRPLNKRGERDAPRMGKRLKERSIVPDLLLTSPANRAISTCNKIAEALDCPGYKIKIEEGLYHADEDRILAIIKTINESHDMVLIFGHNPGLTDFVNEITEERIQNIPTCGIVSCSFNVKSWKEIGWKKGIVDFFDFPKKKN